MAESKSGDLTGVSQELASLENKKRDRLPWDDVAARLLQEKLLLTALELHTELSEAGYELPRLRDYFSNPANFEQYAAKNYSDIGPGGSNLNRTSSQTTLDSLDWGHLSEDGERVVDERVAVLEFELRKAKETIQGLRTNLTQVADTQSSGESQDGTSKSTPSTLLSSVQSHEKRTLNFLINEFLVTNSYKLTAITFADENDDQDFEHWDDVGLNVSRPPNLVQLLRNSGQSFADRSNVHCQTEYITQHVPSSIPQETQAEITSLHGQLEEMKIALSNSERELKELQQRASTPAVTPLNTPKKSLTNSRRERPDILEIDGGRKSPEGTSDTEETSVGAPSGFVMVTPPDRHEKNKELHHIETYDQDQNPSMLVRGPLIGLDACLEGFEVHTESIAESIEDAIETGYREKQFDQVELSGPDNGTESSKDNVDSSSISTLTESVLGTPSQVEDLSAHLEDISVHVEDISGQVEDISAMQTPTDSISKAESIEYASIPVEYVAPMTETEKLKHIQQLKSEARDLLRSTSKRLPSDKFEDEILNASLKHTILNESHLQSAVTVVEPSLTDLLQVVVKSLHNIAPNVILAKREELLPLLVYGVSLHPEAKEREQLLHLLFNLIKRPDDSQRNTILMGLVTLARVLGSTRLEAELLPQCWEQLNHKYMERRLLVAQSTAALAPYTPPTLRNSLLLSMLQQLVSPGGEKELVVREAALTSLSLLITYLDDQSKIPPLVDILIHCLENATCATDSLPLSPEPARPPSNVNTNSSSPSIFQDGTDTLLMSLGMWVLEGNCLNLLLEPIIVRISQLATQLHQYHGDIDNLQNLQTTQVALVAVVDALRKILPFLIAVLINTLPTSDDLSNMNNSSYTALPPAGIAIDQVEIILGCKDKANNGLVAFYHHVSKEWYKTWPELDYVTQEMIPTLVGVLRHIDASGQNHVQAFVKLFGELSVFLGHHLTSSYISPLFMKHLTIEDTELEAVKQGKTGLTRSMVVVYCVALLAPSQHGGRDDKNELEGFLSRVLSILALCKASCEALYVTVAILMQTKHYQEVVLTSLWSCLVHKSPVVRACSAGLWGIVIGCVEDAALGSRVVPALVTLATDQDIVARASAVQPLATVIITTNNIELLDKVWFQLESLCEDASIIENRHFQMALAQTCIRLASSSHPKLLQQFLLPRLCRLVTGGHIKEDPAHTVNLVILDAYSALTCTQPLPDHVCAHFIIPSLQQLQKTLGGMSFEHMEIITDLLKEYSLRASTAQDLERRPSSVSISGSIPVHPGVDEMKNKMTKMFSVRPSATNVLQAKAQAMNVNLPGFFKKK